MIVLLPNPAFAANVWAGEKLLQAPREVIVAAELNVLRHFARHWRFPARQRTFVHGRVVSEGLIRNLGDDFSVLEHAQLVVGCDLANFDRIESPFFKDAKDFLLAAFLGDEQHAFLRLAQHDFVRSHAGFALRHAVKLDFDAHAAARAHLAGRAGESGRAHILNADNRSGLHGFEAGFEQQLLQERIADLHVRTLGFRSFAEFLAGHGRAVDAVASGLGANVDHRIAFAGGARVEDFVFAHQSHGECVHQRIAGVARLELRLAAQVGHAEAIAVGSDAADHAFEDGVVL